MCNYFLLHARALKGPRPQVWVFGQALRMAYLHTTQKTFYNHGTLLNFPTQNIQLLTLVMKMTQTWAVKEVGCSASSVRCDRRTRCWDVRWMAPVWHPYLLLSSAPTLRGWVSLHVPMARNWAPQFAGRSGRSDPAPVESVWGGQRSGQFEC